MSNIVLLHFVLLYSCKAPVASYDPGPTAWNSILPNAPKYPQLEENINADWVVIGAGFAGLAAAKRLRVLHPKDSIVILEARRIAEGPAGRNSGFMIDLPHNLSAQDYVGELNADVLQTTDQPSTTRVLSCHGAMSLCSGFGRVSRRK